MTVLDVVHPGPRPVQGGWSLRGNAEIPLGKIGRQKMPPHQEVERILAKTLHIEGWARRKAA